MIILYNRNLENNARFQGGAWSFSGNVKAVFTNVMFQSTWTTLKGCPTSSYSVLLLLSLGGCIFTTEASVVLSGVTFDVLHYYSFL